MKRFYKEVSFTKEKGGFGIALDGRPVKTPAKETLQAPTEALVKAMAAEWGGQSEEIDPASMPLNRLANTAIDRTATRFEEVAREALGFARHDALCYRADGPEELIKAEAKAWDPYLEWMANDHSAPFQTTTGIGSVDQDTGTLKAVKAMLDVMDPFILTGLHNATTLTGSLILGLALEKGFQDAEAVWQAAHVDEDFQIQKWGKDEEAAKIRAGKKEMFLAVDQFFQLLKA